MLVTKRPFLSSGADFVLEAIITASGQVSVSVYRYVSGKCGWKQFAVSSCPGSLSVAKEIVQQLFSGALKFHSALYDGKKVGWFTDQGDVPKLMLQEKFSVDCSDDTLVGDFLRAISANRVAVSEFLV